MATQLLGGDSAKQPAAAPRGVKRAATTAEHADDFIRLPSVIAEQEGEQADTGGGGGDELDKLSAAMDKPQRKKPAVKKLLDLKQAPRSSALLKGT